MLDTTRWIGASGQQYPYEIHPIETTWTDLPGNYIFAKEATPDRWVPLYMGETQSFRYSLPCHSELARIRKLGGTHVHVHVNPDRATREREEADLLASPPKPPCNS